MKFFIGIDQGGTKTNAVIINESGELVASGKARGAYFLLDGIEAQMDAISEAVQNAFDNSSGITQIDGLYAGLIGADWPDEQEMLSHEITKLKLAPRNVVVNDSFIAMRGGTENSFGAILIAGTGGNCAIVSPDGNQFLYHFYQEAELQGGSAIGRAALDAIFKAETGRAPITCLKDSVLQMAKLPDVDTLLRQDVEERLPIKISVLAPLVFKAAENGDGPANSILRNFAIGLASLITAGIQRFNMTDLQVEVVLSGSIFKSNHKVFINTLRNSINEIAPKAVLIQARYEPVVGAAILALEKWGVEITKQVKENIEKTSLEFGLIRILSNEL